MLTPDEAVGRVMTQQDMARLYTFDDVCDLAYEVANAMFIPPGSETHCSACGAPICSHRHGMTGILIAGLGVLYRAGPGPHHIPHLGMRNSVQTNFQKLRYWGLVRNAPSPQTGALQTGWWEITELGERFVRGEVDVPSHVVTYRADVIERSDTRVSIDDLVPDAQTRDEFRRLMQPLNTNNG